MAWLESHQSLGRHPKLFRLAVQLRIHKAQAIGHLQYLWWWALDFAPKGDLSAFTPAEISAGAEWPGEPGLFHKALGDCGWIDPDGQVHGWMDYAGKLVEIREKDRDRKRIQRMSDGHPADVLRMSDVPNTTQPNTTNQPTGVPPGFEEFWNAWPPNPRKVAKSQCLKKWQSLDCEPISIAVISALNRFKSSSDWLKDGGQFVPQPATWLNQRRWEAMGPKLPEQPPQSRISDF